MELQAAIVAILVPGCAVYAAWRLAPAGLKRRVARRLLDARVPAPLAQALRRAANTGGGCGCDGCDAAPAKPVVAPVTLHRRRP